MKKEAINSFSGGLISDLNELTTPPSVLTDALNATILTFNGNELVLQNDMGNTSLIDPSDIDKKVQLSEGFIPIGIKEHGEIIYIISYNNISKEVEIGSFPSPNFSNLPEKPEEISTPGILLEENINKIYPLTDSEIKSGDYFVITIPVNNPNILTSYTERKYYIPKLINIDTNKDITNRFTKQDYLTNGVVQTDNNFWFLQNKNYNLSDYIAKDIAKIYPFDLKKGRLGVKFELEDIDLFRMNYNETQYPIFSSSNNGINIYKLEFKRFEIIEPSLFKCDKIIIDYKLYNNTTPLDIWRSGTIILTPFNYNKVIINGKSYITPKLEITTTIDDIPSKNYSIEYTITPMNTIYDREFTKYIINERIDLSKDPGLWGVLEGYVIDNSFVYDQKIDANYTSTNYIFNLQPAQKSLPKPFTFIKNDRSTKLNYLVSDLKLINLPWINNINNNYISLDCRITIYNNIILNEDSGQVIMQLHNTLYDYNQDENINITSSYETSTSNKFYNKFFNINRPININEVNDSIEFSIDTTLRCTSGNPILSFAANGLTISEAKATIPNKTGYEIYPVIGRNKFISNVPTAISTASGKIEEATINTNTELFPTTSWNHSLYVNTLPITSFKTNNGNYNRISFKINNSQTSNQISKTISGLTPNSYYILSFYAKSDNDSILKYGLNVISGFVSLTNKFKLYTLVIQASSSNSIIFNMTALNSEANIIIANVSVKLKNNQDLTLENYQDVYCYEENIILLKNKDTNQPVLSNNGVFLPYPNKNIIDTFSLSKDGEFITNEVIIDKTFIVRKQWT